MTLKRIGVASCAKILGILYAAGGLLFGLIFSLFSVVGATLGTWADRSGAGPWAIFFGVGAIVILPVLYGVLGAIGGAITAGLYNVVAHLVGGVELDLEPRTGQAGFVRRGEEI